MLMASPHKELRSLGTLMDIEAELIPYKSERGSRRSLTPALSEVDQQEIVEIGNVEFSDLTRDSTTLRSTA